MTSDQEKECHLIIHAASVAAFGVGAGLAQIPGADCVALAGIQTAMVVALGKVFGKTIQQGAAVAAVATMFAQTVGKVAAKYAVGVVTKWIPGIGNYVNGTIAATVTELMGWALADEIEKGLIGKNKKE